MNFYRILKEHFGLDSERKALYRKVDWIAIGLTFLIAFVGYLITLAPDLTLEDSGELAVGSYYAGVPTLPATLSGPFTLGFLPYWCQFPTLPIVLPSLQHLPRLSPAV